MIKSEDVECSKFYSWIPGYEGLYSASRDGRIISYWGGEPKELSLTENRQWLSVGLYDKEGDPTTYKVHRLILEAFDRERREGEECRHLNGKGSDNRLENLDWGSHSQNMKDAYNHGKLDQSGEKNANSSLTESDVSEIRSIVDLNIINNYSKLARMYDVSTKTISLIARRKTWKEVQAKHKHH